MLETELSFPSYDGTRLQGTLALPEGRSERVVLMVHGLLSSRNGLGIFPVLAEQLSHQGVPSFRFDYRCHGANSQEMSLLTLSGIVNDIEAAAELALSQTRADTIQVVGMSFGGGLAAFWAASTDSNVAALVMLAPVIDYEYELLGKNGLLSAGILTEDARRRLRDRRFLEIDGVEYGPGLINELRFISGVAGLRRLRCQALIIHGDADSIVPFASSERFVKLNPRCSLLNIPGTGHGFSVGGSDSYSSPETKAKQLEVSRLIIDFLAAAESDSIASEDVDNSSLRRAI